MFLLALQDPAGIMELDSYDMIADAAQYILDKCHISSKSQNFGWVAGQVFMKDKWSVIVQGIEDGTC